MLGGLLILFILGVFWGLLYVSQESINKENRRLEKDLIGILHKELERRANRDK